MKLLFVENRYATWVYELVARELARDGHEIHWLVQNPVFTPCWGKVHTLPFPTKTTRAAAVEGYSWLRRSDRGALHFGAGTSHYAHYDRLIGAALDAIAPDVIFGEPTEFHELLTISHARQRHRPYLSPNVTRYPADRLAFTAYDAMDPVGGDGSLLPDDEADAMLARIRDGQLVPSYMRPTPTPPRSARWVRLRDKLRITAGWLAGERYITPSPLRKLVLEAAQRKQRSRWDEQAADRSAQFQRLLQSGQPWVLYPLQMQPESNIDVWGHPWNNQTDIVRRAARALAGMNATLVVKPNPKSKYELTASLNDVVRTEPNVIGLAHATPMREVFPGAPLVFTVTGTVLLEAVIAGKPVASLGRHGMCRYPGVTALSAPEELLDVLVAAVRGEVPVASSQQARTLLQQIHASSYPAKWWDPIATPHALATGVLPPLIRAFRHVLTQHMSTGAWVTPPTALGDSMALSHRAAAQLSPLSAP